MANPIYSEGFAKRANPRSINCVETGRDRGDLGCMGSQTTFEIRAKGAEGPRIQPSKPACFRGIDLEARWNTLSGPPVVMRYIPPPDMPETPTSVAETGFRF